MRGVEPQLSGPLEARTARRVRDPVLGRVRDAFVAVDAEGVVVGWNPAAERLLGWSAEAVLGRTAFADLVPRRHRAAFADRVAARLAGDVDADEETVLVVRTATGDELVVSGAAGVVEADDGEPCAFALLHAVADDDPVAVLRHLERLDERERDAASPDVPVRTTDAATSVVARRVLAFARELLGLDVLWVSRFEGRRLLLVLVDGDTELLGGVAGDAVPLASSFCARVVDGRIPGVVPDVQADGRTAMLPAAEGEHGFGAFLGVPLQSADGREHGTLCGATRDARPELGEHELRLLDALADTLGDVLDEAEASVAARRGERETQAIAALVAALDARDAMMADHSRSVVALSLAVALELGLSTAQEEEIAHVALLHDIGKLGVPEAVLRQRGGLDAQQRRLMDAHATIGARIVGRVAAIGHLAPAIRAGHERFDGAGTPDGLAGEAIPLASRIVHACEAWDAMTNDRPYRRAMNDHAALGELRRHAGGQFDPAVVEALVTVLRRWR